MTYLQASWLHDTLLSYLGSATVNLTINGDVTATAELTIGPGLGQSLNSAEYLLGGDSELTLNAAEISSDNFVSPTILYGDGLLAAPLLDLGSTSANAFSLYLLQAGISYQIRVHSINEQNSYLTTKSNNSSEARATNRRVDLTIID